MTGPRLATATVLIALAASHVGCTRSDSRIAPEGPATARLEPASGERPSAEDSAAVRAMVAESSTWGRATPTAFEKLADCRAIFSKEASTHLKGEKFHVFVRGGPGQVEAYREGRALAPDAAVVKRTFVPREAGAGVVLEKLEEEGTVTAFFLMYRKPGKSTPGDGWLYATTRPDGTVLRAGALADCASCHEKRREHDSLFGIEWGKPPR